MTILIRIRTIRRCRICKYPKLIPLYTLGKLAISNFVSPGTHSPKAPLEMVMCTQCRLVQLKHTAPQELLYARYYWYKSGVTQTMRKGLADITKQIARVINLKKGDVVLDIGSNDGTLLRTYVQRGLLTVGVEPANNLVQEGKKGISIFIHDFWNYTSFIKRVRKKAKVITAIGMFYDMDDPNDFIRDACRALTDDGIFVAQLMCLQNMIDTNDIGNICHEHLEYYSLETLIYLFEKNGLELVDLYKNDINGGSYRLYTRKKRGSFMPPKGAKDRIQRYLKEEQSLKYIKTYKAFFKKVEQNKKKTVDFITKVTKQGKKVWVYGASTKGNTILQYYGLTSRLIEAASERSPEKWGKVTVGTHIPIVSEAEARKASPDFFLVLPYAFINEFVRREQKWLSKGGTFIVPLPTFRLLS